MLRHLPEVASLASLAHMAIDCARECGNNLQKCQLARNGEAQLPQSFRKIGLACGLRDLRQQPKGMCEAFVLRRPFEAMFRGIGACSGNPLDVRTARDQVDDLIPFLGFWKRSEANVTHRLHPKSTDQRQQIGSFVQTGLTTDAPGHPHKGRRGSAVQSRASPRGP